MKKRAEHKAWWLPLWTCRIKKRGPLLSTTTPSTIPHRAVISHISARSAMRPTQTSGDTRGVVARSHDSRCGRQFAVAKMTPKFSLTRSEVVHQGGHILLSGNRVCCNEKSVSGLGSSINFGKMDLGRHRLSLLIRA